MKKLDKKIPRVPYSKYHVTGSATMLNLNTFHLKMGLYYSIRLEFFSFHSSHLWCSFVVTETNKLSPEVKYNATPNLYRKYIKVCLTSRFFLKNLLSPTFMNIVIAVFKILPSFFTIFLSRTS